MISPDCPDLLAWREGQYVEPEGLDTVLLGTVEATLAVLVILIGLVPA